MKVFRRYTLESGKKYCYYLTGNDSTQENLDNILSNANTTITLTGKDNTEENLEKIRKDSGATEFGTSRTPASTTLDITYRIEEVVIDGFEDKKLDLSPLERCNDLETLQISNSQTINELNLYPLQDASKLSKLTLIGLPNVTSLDLAPFSGATEQSGFRDLWIEKLNLAELDIGPLRYIEIVHFKVGDIPISKIVRSDPEEWIDNTEGPRITDNVDFYNMPNLRELSIDFLSDSEQLRQLGIRDCGLERLDISALSGCKQLKRLNLPDNQLENIDLSSLSSCANLSEIDLSGNQLKEIDLSPLSSCANLSGIDLNRNKFIEIDLSPLSSCANLSRIDLSGDQLKEIDLSPLKNLPITHLDLEYNKIEEVDITPVISPKLKTFRFGPDTKAIASKEVKYVSRESFSRYYLRPNWDLVKQDGTPTMSWGYKRGIDAIEWY